MTLGRELGEVSLGILPVEDPELVHLDGPALDELHAHAPVDRNLDLGGLIGCPKQRHLVDRKTLVFDTCNAVWQGPSTPNSWRSGRSRKTEEGERRVLRFLNHHSDFRRLAVEAAAIGGKDSWISPAGDLRTLPFHMAEAGGMDGFYAARLQRIGEAAR